MIRITGSSSSGLDIYTATMCELSTIDSEDGMGWIRKVFVLCVHLHYIAACAFSGHLSNGSGERGMLVEI